MIGLTAAALAQAPTGGLSLGSILSGINAGSGLLSSVGGLFGGSGSSSKQASRLAVEAEERAISNQYQMAENLPKYQVAGWKAAGIHPLAGMGLPMAQAPAFQVGAGTPDGGWASKLSDMGSGVSRAVGALQSREEREIAMASAKLGLENQRLQNVRLASEINQINAPGTPPGFSMSTAIPGQGDARYPLQKAMALGLGDTAPLLRVGRDQKGNPIRTWNDDLGDNEVMQTLTALGFSVPDWIHGNIGKPAARQLRKFFTRDDRSLKRIYRSPRARKYPHIKR